MADPKDIAGWARRRRSGLGVVGYNSQDEPPEDYAGRQEEQALQADQLEDYRDQVPQTEPVVAPVLADVESLAAALAGDEGVMAAGLAALPDDMLPVVELLAQIALARRDPGLPALAAMVTPETNPPSWIGDEATWEKAKAAVKPRWDSYSEPYAVVTSVYENMGGTFK